MKIAEKMLYMIMSLGERDVWHNVELNIQCCTPELGIMSDLRDMK